MTKRASSSPASPAASADIAREFETHRRFLWGLCYRMTGSAADADDLVQETFVRALERPPGRRADGWRSWLARVATNLSIDALRRRKRRDYVGPWLPSPIETGDDAAPPAYEISSAEESTEYRYDLLESVSMAFLLALERLTPRQRAVLLLRDVFDYTVQETAKALDLTHTNVKVTHHRARRAMKEYDGHRVRPTADHQARSAERLRQFITHLQNQDVAGVESMLAEDARFLGDGGGEFAAAVNPVLGRHRVAKLLVGLAAKLAPAPVFDIHLLNGEPALLIQVAAPKGFAPRYVFRIDAGSDGAIRDVHTILASRKLTGVRFR